MSVASALAGPAGAAEAPEGADASSAESAEVEPLIRRAIELRTAGDDRAALRPLTEALSQAPSSVRVLVHLAATYQALGEWEAADKHLTLALTDPQHPYVQRHQATLAEARQVIDSHIGTLQVDGQPEGAEVVLNGRVMGTLPLTDGIRVAAGIYTLEVRRAGHYPVTRSVALSGGVLTREAVRLAPGVEGVTVPGVVRGPSRAREGGPAWVPWTFAGLSAGAAVVAVGAWATRERYAERWNDDGRCLQASQTRQQVCGSDLRRGEAAEAWLIGSGAAAGVFAASAVIAATLTGSAGDEQVGAVRCGAGWMALSCSGKF